MRRLLIGIAVVAGLLVAADFGLRLYSERVVGDEIKAALRLSERPSVSFGGWPFTPHLISGDLPSASFSADTFTAGGVPLRRVHVSLSDVRFPSSRLLSGGGGTIRASSGHGTAVMTADDINAALQKQGLPLTVSIEDGKATVSEGALKVGLDLNLVDASLALAPAAVDVASARLGLPSIVPGLTYSSVRLEGSEAVLSFRLHKPVFVVPA